MPVVEDCAAGDGGGVFCPHPFFAPQNEVYTALRLELDEPYQPRKPLGILNDVFLGL